MKIFLSWSGDRSKRVSELLAEWLPTLINQIDPWISSRDIPSGSSWLNQINEQLANRTFGIACLTRENKHSPWILFECGALAKGLTESRIYILCIDLKTTDVERPLGDYNGVQVDEKGIKKLIFDINRETDVPVKETVLERAFSNGWPHFKNDFERVLAETEHSTNSDLQPDTPSQISEVLERIRQMDKRLEDALSSDRIISNSSNRTKARSAKLEWKQNFRISVDAESLFDRISSEDLVKRIRDSIKVKSIAVHVLDAGRDTRSIYFDEILSESTQEYFEQILLESGWKIDAVRINPEV